MRGAARDCPSLVLAEAHNAGARAGLRVDGHGDRDELGDGEGILWREGDPFPPAFHGTVEDDGKTIVGRWEKGVESMLRGRL
jgi:hypothetical protein